MAVQWADNFGRYGIGAGSGTKMKDGLPYNNWLSDCIVDPDPLAAANGERCLAVNNGLTNNPLIENRIALPTPTAGLVGWCHRVWHGNMPSGTSDRPSVVFYTVAGTALACMKLEPNGAYSLYNALNGTQIATTVVPVISTNSWNHVEVAYNGTTGAIEARLNGVTILTGVASATGTIAFVTQTLRDGTGTGQSVRIKDLVIWDGTGTRNNNFMGTVICRRFLPNADVTLGGWLPSAGTTGYDLLADSAPANVFTVTGQLTPDGANNIRINNTYYRPTAGSVDAGAPAGTSANPWLVAMGVDAAASLSNLFNAINATGVAGTTYSTALTAHPNVSGKGLSATQFVITANDGVTTTYVCTETMANASWATGTVSLIGPQDLSYLSADDTPPAPMQFALQDLPPDVTSVRAILPVVRARKIDGGDGNIQTSLISNGDFANGADRPITTAFTYYFDVDELSPDTGNPWTPVEFDAATSQISRTL